MKKRVLFLLFIVFMPLLSILIIPHVHAVVYIMQDNFEDGDISDWSEYGIPGKQHKEPCPTRPQKQHPYH